MNRLFSLAFVVFFSALGPVHAQDKPYFEKSDELTNKDPRDTKITKSYAKVHEVQLKGDQLYRIDLMSKDFDALLRLEDADGGKIAIDDDSGDKTDSRLIVSVPRDGVYKLVVMSALPLETGKYTLIVRDPTKIDLFASKTQSFARLDNDAKTKLLEDVIAHLEERGKKISNEDGNLVFSLVFAMQNSKMRGVGDWCQKISKALAVGESARIQGLSKMAEGVSRRLRLVGNPIALKGTTLEGKEFDWSAYKGKVVLVDFWATWCGPCVAEMPKLKQLYEENKEKGFEIVGISLDDDGKAPTRFMEKKGLTWTCLHEKGVRNQPLADYYGVMAIPLAILVGADGNVISTTARGPELERLLEKHLQKE